jgi:hypothetical protein
MKIMKKSVKKRKPRHNPNKPQNKYGYWCQACDVIWGRLVCEMGGNTDVCEGNPHNCIKAELHRKASIRESSGSDKKRI